MLHRLDEGAIVQGKAGVRKHDQKFVDARYRVCARDDHVRQLSTPTTKYRDKNIVVEPPKVVIKLRKARFILYTTLRKFWLIQNIFWAAGLGGNGGYAMGLVVQHLQLQHEMEQHQHAFDALWVACGLLKA